MLWAAAQVSPDALTSYSEGSDLPIPASLAVKSAPVVVRLERMLNRSTDEAVREDLAALAAHLDRADGYVAEGTIGGDPPNVADLQVASSLRLVMTLDDLRPAIEARPSGQLALRLFPEYPGRIPSGSVASA